MGHSDPSTLASVYQHLSHEPEHLAEAGSAGRWQAVNGYPVILNHARSKLRGYSRETTIAEKFEAMVSMDCCAAG